MARPTLLTPEVHLEVVSYMKAGAGFYRAAALAGLSKDTVRKWRRRGEDGEEPFAQFAIDVSRQMGTRAAAAEKSIHKAIEKGDTRSAQWYLERVHPEDYGRKDTTRLEVATGVQSVIEAVEPHMSRESYAELVRAIARIQGLDIGEAGESEQGSRAH